MTIRPAVMEDLEALSRIRTQSILEAAQNAYSGRQLRQWAGVSHGERTRNRIADGCVLAGIRGNRIIATNGIDLESEEMVGLFVLPVFQGRGIGRRMVVAAERLAVQFGMSRLRIESAVPTIAFYQSCGYQAEPGAKVTSDSRTGLGALTLWRTFPRRQTRYGARIRRVLNDLGIAADYGRKHRLKLQGECRELATIGTDIHGREQLLAPASARAWYAMRNAAAEDGVDLEVASAFRSVGYQTGIIERKKHHGQSISDILKVSAAPGYSEHHTGRAIDLTTPGSEPLETCFENTLAFEWLTGSAHQFGFTLSYPRNNRYGIAYEPWHWARRRR